ncbi:transposase [Patescibacteria group bacterium]|nr:transposase [Patescibacteria group bacterium]
MSNGVRRHYTPRQKAEVVRRHATGKEPVSKLAEELGVQPSQIHGWVNQVLAQAEAAFQRAARPRRDDQRKDEKIARLEAKLVQKNEVIAELLEENVRAKKANGEL